MFENGKEYVRCVLIDYSKAFDMIDHATLLTEPGCLGLHARQQFIFILFYFVISKSFSYYNNMA